MGGIGCIVVLCDSSWFGMVVPMCDFFTVGFGICMSMVRICGGSGGGGGDLL